jgi:outer membrane protein assembly factor BamA
VISLLLALLLAQEAPVPTSYDDLLAQGLALGREGKLQEASEALSRAIALDPRRPEAYVERGGLRFLEKKYDAAVVDLETSLDLREDPYTRDLLASSLHLAGRSDDALARWNTLGEPRVDTLTISGLTHTKDRIVRREVSLAEGDLLDLDELRASRARLREVGVFDRVTLRPVPKGEGKADLEVALAERHGIFATPADFVVSTAVNALDRRFRLRYSNLAGRGINFGGQYRWQDSRPEVSLFLDWARPLGLPAYLHILSFRGRQLYDLEGESLTRRSRGVDLSMRHVFGARTVGQIGMRLRDRTFSGRGPAAPGAIVGLEAGVERPLVDAYRHRLDGSLRGFTAIRGLGSDLAYGTGQASLGYRAHLSRPDGTAIEPSVLALRVLWGGQTIKTPLDEMFAPGGSHDMEFPLRAHRQLRRGVLGITPIGRSLVLGNLEWRPRFFDRTAGQAGFVIFLDTGRVANSIVGRRSQAFADVGLGLRVAFRGSPVIRLDFGHGLSDGKNALFIGLGQVF